MSRHDARILHILAESQFEGVARPVAVGIREFPGLDGDRGACRQVGREGVFHPPEVPCIDLVRLWRDVREHFFDIRETGIPFRLCFPYLASGGGSVTLQALALRVLDGVFFW